MAQIEVTEDVIRDWAGEAVRAGHVAGREGVRLVGDHVGA
jgi:hypothetical protein